MGIFHEVLPGNLVFFHFLLIRLSIFGLTIPTIRIPIKFHVYSYIICPGWMNLPRKLIWSWCDVRSKLKGVPESDYFFHIRLSSTILQTSGLKSTAPILVAIIEVFDLSLSLEQNSKRHARVLPRWKCIKSQNILLKKIFLTHYSWTLWPASSHH